MQKPEPELTFKSLFLPFTTKKAIIFIIIIGIAVFFNSLFNGFVGDDKSYIINYVPLHVINIPFLVGTNLFNIGGQYRPIPAVYFSLLYQLFGNTAFLYRLLQISLHIICTLLLFKFFRKFITLPVAFFACLVFLIHPMNVESVAYIAQSVNPLFFLFGFIALFIAVKDKLFIQDFLMIFVFLLLSLLTKETGVLFIALAITYRFLFNKSNFKELLVTSFLTVITYLPIRFLIGQVSFSTRFLPPISNLTLFGRILQSPSILAYYLKTFFFPLSLAMDQEWINKSLNLGTFYLPLILELLILSLAVFYGYYLYKNNNKYLNPYLFFLVWAGLGFFMHSQIVPLDATVADRWFYFTMAGLVGFLAVIYQSFAIKLKRLKALSLIFAVVIITSLSLRTVVRNTNWIDQLTLLNHDIKVSDNYNIEETLGVEYAQKGDALNAIKHFQRSIDFRPYEGNLHNLGVIYAVNLGEIGKAKEVFSAALNAKDYKVTPGHRHIINTYIDLATVMIFYDKNPKAIPFINNALVDYPDSADLYVLLAIAKYNLRDKDGALAALGKAYHVNSDTYLYNRILNNQPFAVKIYNKSFSFSPL
jgi:tetratricopeptide (TPR) repeat protein